MRRARRKVSVLVVDDDPVLLDGVARLLELEGFGVIASSEPCEALARASEAKALDLLLADVAMPRLDGPGLAARLRAARPEVKVVYMSGHPVETARRDFGVPQEALFLRKPFTRDALARMLDGALSGD